MVKWSASQFFFFWKEVGKFTKVVKNHFFLTREKHAPLYLVKIKKTIIRPFLPKARYMGARDGGAEHPVQR